VREKQLPKKMVVTKRQKTFFVSVNGEKVARRGYPNSPQAGTWVSLEPGWGVIDMDGDIGIRYNGVTVQWSGDVPKITSARAYSSGANDRSLSLMDRSMILLTTVSASASEFASPIRSN
jgi:hypothetical protein